MPIANIRDHRLTVAVADTAIPAAVAMMRATAGAAAVITRFRFSDASQSGTFVLLGLAGSTIVRISGAVTVTAGGTKLTGETTYDVQAQAQALTGVNAYYWLCTVAPMAGSVDIQTWEVSEAEGLTYAMANMELNLGNVGLLSAAEAEINPATLEAVQAVSNGQTSVGDGTGTKPGVMLLAVQTAVASLKAATDALAAAGGGAYLRQDSTGTIAKESGGNLASIKTNSDTLSAAGAGGYVRQDSTATVAKESGGNLALAAQRVAGPLTDLGSDQRLTGAGASQTATIPATTTLVRLTAESLGLRWTLTGVNATATSGALLEAGATEWLDVTDAASLRMWLLTGGFGNLAYFKRGA